MTPKEFKEIIEKYKKYYIEKCDDEEMFHIKVDGLMCDVLTKLGYGDGVKIFEQTPKWYS